MTKNILIVALMAGIVGFTTKCHPTQHSKSAGSADMVNKEQTQKADSTLYAILESQNDTPSLRDSLMIRFTVTNPTKDSLRFTTYHTPFEGFISKFLTVTDSKGKQIDYIGPMAKRVMPPPESTYHTLDAGQSEKVLFDLKKGYKIEHPGVYTLKYNGENISGIANGAAITITVVQ